MDMGSVRLAAWVLLSNFGFEYWFVFNWCILALNTLAFLVYLS